MTLVKTHQPPNVVLAGDPVLFGFRSNNTILQQGVRAEFVLIINFMPNPYYGFDLYIGGVPYAFTFVPQPGNDPSELPADYIGVGFGTFDMYLTQVRDEFLKHPYISKHYDVIVLGAPFNPYLLFKAKQPGARFTIEIGVGPGMPVSTNNGMNLAGVDEIAQPFYGVFLQTYIEGELAGEDLLSVDKDGNAAYDVSAYLKAYHSTSFTWPVTSHMKKRPDLLKRFWVRYADRYGVPPVINKLQSTQGFISHALPGGTGFMQNSLYAAQNSSFWNALQYSRQFLTHQPKTKLVKADQMQKLWFLVYDAVTSLTLRCELETFDSIGTPIVVDLATLAVQKFDVLEINFQINDAYELIPPQLSDLYSMKVSLVTPAGVQFSEKRTYLVDYKAELHAHQFIWRNSFGMYDSHLFTGRHQQMVKSEKQVYALSNRYHFSATDSPAKVFRSTEVEMFGASSGWIEDKALVNWLRELSLSKEVYEVIENNLHPVVVTSAEIDMITQGKTLHNIQFEYARAYTDEHFSKITGTMAAKFIQSFNQANDPQFNPIQPVPTP